MASEGSESRLTRSASEFEVDEWDQHRSTWAQVRRTPTPAHPSRPCPRATAVSSLTLTLCVARSMSWPAPSPG
eukprot:scaffold107600_cov66-Phaeocystis_antarctica.AAC.6